MSISIPAFRRYAAHGLAAAIATATALDAAPVTDAQVAAALPKLRAMAENMIATGKVPGLAIVIVHNDETVFVEGFGLRNAAAPETVDGDTVFQLASMSKPISGTVVASLVGKGLVDWDSRIADLMPSFRMHDPYPTAEVTVRDMFNHRSGLPGGAGNDLEDIGYDRDHVMAQLRLVAPSSSFRSGYAYSNAGITVGAVAAAGVTGKDWETVAEVELFGPLGMTSTSYRYGDFTARTNAAALHIPEGDTWAAKLKRDPTAQAPAGSASASARDLAEWMKLELANGKRAGGQLIAEDALAATHVPLFARGANPVTGGASFYGLGWNVEFGRYGTTWGHAGAFSLGARTVVTLWPDSNLGITVLANAFPTGVPEGVAETFADLVFAGEVTQDWVTPWNTIYGGLFGPAIAAAEATYGTPPATVTPALPAEAYVGTYSNAYVGDAVVEAEGDGLVLVLGPEGNRRLPLTHFDRDLFLYYIDLEMPTMPTPLQFTIGPDGKAASMSAATFAGNGWDVLTRKE
jgi:CubicO group peptidase (beta-lactamase class C family)